MSGKNKKMDARLKPCAERLKGLFQAFFMPLSFMPFLLGRPACRGGLDSGIKNKYNRDSGYVKTMLADDSHGPGRFRLKRSDH
jgi:hypothetical protein